MAKLTTFSNMSNADYRAMCADMKATLKAFEEKWGVKVDTKNARHSGFNMDLKLQLTIANASGAPVITKEVEDWNRYHMSFGFKKEELNKQFMYNGEKLEIIGLLPKRHKYPVLCKRVGQINAKNIILSEMAARTALNANPVA